MLMLAGTLLLVAAFVLAWLNILEDRRAGEASRAIVMQMRQSMPQHAGSQPAAQPNAPATAQPEAAVTAQPGAAATVQPDATATAQPGAAATAQPDAAATVQPTATPQPEAKKGSLFDALLKLLPDALLRLLALLPDALPAPMPTPVMPLPTLPPMDDIAVLAVEPDFIRHPDMEMPVTEVDGHAYIGVLDIPRLERSLPVMAELSYPKLKISPCLYTGSVYSRDAVISAHNYEEHLRFLWQLEPGDEVRFTDVSGNVFLYRVILQEILAPYEVERMTTRTDWDLTLFTCKTGGRMRITTRCALESYIAAPSAQQTEEQANQE